MKTSVISILIFTSCVLSAQRFEAENATLDDGAVSRNSPVASGGRFVEMREGRVSFSVIMQEPGMRAMTIVYSLTLDDFKSQNLEVNGTPVGTVAFRRTGGGATPVFAETTAFVSLPAGTNTVAITRSWGWVAVDFVEFAERKSVKFNVEPAPATPNPTAGATRLYSFLRENFQRKTISGVMTSDKMLDEKGGPLPFAKQREIAFVFGASGKMPALVGFDFMDSTDKPENKWRRDFTEATLAMATELWKAGGIPAFCWHWRNPLRKDDEFSTARTNFDLSKAFVDSECTKYNVDSDEYKAIIRDIDTVSALLKRLQDEGVAVLWRPLHEASGGWFWWGAKGATPCKALWRLMFERMTNHHGLRNLIWVWTADGSDADWYPGDDLADIIGRDFYHNPRRKNHSSLVGEFETLKVVFGARKMLALAENGSIPHPAAMFADNAVWLYFMPWNGEFTMPVNGSDDNTAADWRLIMNDERVVTLEDMPGWK